MTQKILVGETLDDRYKLLDLIGKGKSGFVYKAEQTKFNRPVAVKVLHEHLLGSQESVKRFQREAEAISKLRHDSLLEIIDFGFTQSKQPYMVTELLQGLSLEELLSQEKLFELNETVEIFKQICSALMIAHSQKIIHRDIKPSNIFIVRNKQGQIVPKIIDFGLVKFLDDSDKTDLTQMGTIKGTPQFISPEQCTGQQAVDHRSDIYSLGCVLYQALCGKPPFEGEDITDLLFKHVKEPAPSLTQFKIPGTLDQVVQKSMAKAQDERHQTMDEFQVALDQFLSQQAAPPPPAPSKVEQAPAPQEVKIDMAPPQAEVVQSTPAKSKNVMHDVERSSHSLLDRDQYWSVDAKESQVFDGMRKRQTEELSERILRSVQSSFVGDQTMAWLQNPSEDIDLKAEAGSQNYCQLNMAKLMDQLFDDFQRYSYQYNQTEENREYVISCARPKTIQGPEPQYTGHLQNSVWALQVIGDSHSVRCAFVQTKYLYREELLSPVVILELKVQNTAQGPAWSVEGNPIFESQLTKLSKKIFARLVRVSRGEVSENEVLKFNTSEETDGQNAAENSLSDVKQDPRDVITYSLITILEAIDNRLVDLQSEGMQAMQQGGIDAVGPVMAETKKYTELREKIATMAKEWAGMLTG